VGLHGRVALVTGASRGLGRAIALGLAADGADVVVGFHRDAAGAERTAADMAAVGVRVVLARADLAEPGGPERLAEAAADLGPVGILVCNAGMNPPTATVVDADPADLLAAMTVHALAPHRLCQLLLPGMRTLGRGDVVVVSSRAPTTNRPGRAASSMSKAALESLAATLAKEEVAHGIRVNVIAPGLVATDMGLALARESGVTDTAALERSSPYGRLCTVDDVADMVRFLVSARAAYVNGQRISIDGGGDSATTVAAVQKEGKCAWTIEPDC
jgi:NAD(P)-dependent dehydrogenase (short-subunit alcohol dehydrogenase family)